MGCSGPGRFPSESGPVSWTPPTVPTALPPLAE